MYIWDWRPLYFTILWCECLACRDMNTSLLHNQNHKILNWPHLHPPPLWSKLSLQACQLFTSAAHFVKQVSISYAAAIGGVVVLGNRKGSHQSHTTCILTSYKVNKVYVCFVVKYVCHGYCTDSSADRGLCTQNTVYLQYETPQGYICTVR